jgi:ABC-2 type transport system ATP-binding protein
MLTINRLRKTFGPITAVNDISFNVEKGEVLGFLGPNGAGKTTTMRMITGFLPPTAGTAAIAGYDIVQDPIPAKEQIGYLPENAPLYAEMTVWNYLSFIAEIRGLTGRRRRERLGQTIELCRLESVQHRAIGTLSKGYRQRTCMAQALLHDPPLLIMDEPTDGLDPNQKQVVRGMIREMAARKAIVISTHILEEVEAVCTRTIVICKGALVANGTPAELKAQSRTYGAVEIKFAALPADLRPKLEQLTSAARVETQDHGVIVLPRDPRRLFPDVLALVKANSSWPITGMKSLEGRLDDVFCNLTRSADD